MVNIDQIVNKLTPILSKGIIFVFTTEYGERITRDQIAAFVRSCVFEAYRVSSPEKVEQTAIKICRSRLRSKGTPFYDRVRRWGHGKGRQKSYVDTITTTNWGTPLPPNSCVVTEQKMEMGVLFKYIEKVCGVEIALLFVLHRGYGWSPRRLAKYVLRNEDKTEFYRVYKRLLRIIPRLEEIVRVSYVS